MNSKSALIAMLAAIAIYMTGCSSAHLTKQADINDRAAQVAEESATDLRGILDKYPAGTIEDGQLAQLIAGVLPESQRGRFEALIAIGKSVRESAELIAAELPELAATLRAEAVSLRADAAQNDNQWNNTLASVTSAAKSFGGIIGLVGGLAGIWFKRGKDKAQAATQDIVTSIEAAKAASEQMRDAFANGGGAAMRSSMRPETMRVVRSIRNAT